MPMTCCLAPALLQSRLCLSDQLMEHCTNITAHCCPAFKGSTAGRAGRLKSRGSCPPGRGDQLGALQHGMSHDAPQKPVDRRVVTRLPLVLLASVTLGYLMTSSTLIGGRPVGRRRRGLMEQAEQEGV